MRLSEKTIELNLCAQLRVAFGGNIFWFGLTQKQEARAGFDACTRLGGRLFLFQFKASNWTIRSGDRRFLCPHDQLDALRTRVGMVMRSVFYVFPLCGTTREAQRAGGDLLPTTWLLDVAALASLPPPTTSKGALRKNGKHYVDVSPGRAIIHSDPVKASLENAGDYFRKGMPGGDGLQHHLKRNPPKELFELTRHFSGVAAGAVVLPSPNPVRPFTF